MKKIIRKNYKRIGILGGSFDPPHQGHLYISKIALKKLKLDKIFWVITKKNPLKNRPLLPIKERVKLCKTINKKNKKILVKYFENQIRSVNTFNLLYYMRKKNKNAKIYFLMGADNLKNFHRWKNWQKIPKLAKIAIFARKNYSFNSIARKKLHKTDLIYIKSKLINISSSLIRKFW